MQDKDNENGENNVLSLVLTFQEEVLAYMTVIGKNIEEEVIP